MAGAWDGFFAIPYQLPEDRWLKRKYDKWAKHFGSKKVFPYRIDDWYIPNISPKLSQIKKRVNPEVVLVEYVFMSKAFESFGPDILKILDTHDIFGGRQRLYIERGMIPQWFYTTIAQEKRALDRADVILAIQEEETAYFRRFTQREVITVGHLAQVSGQSESLESQVDRLLFVGSENPINIVGLRWFLSEIFTRVRQEIPAIELDVVGKVADHFAPQQGINLIGPEQDLSPYYKRARIVVNPVRFGTGLKIKAIEALAHGRPLVTTKAGAAGLEKWEGKTFILADTPEEFAKAIVQVWTSPDLGTELTNQALKFVDTYNQTALKPLLDTIARVNT